MSYQLILTTVPSRKDALKIARILISRRVAACVSIVPGAESIFRWKGKAGKAKEFLLLIKTRAAVFRRLEKILAENHPYEVPEILALNVSKGNQKYLKWLAAETA